jgi:hypothetical protein
MAIRNDMPLPKSVGPKDMTYTTYQHIRNLYDRTARAEVMLVVVGCAALAALVLSFGMYIGAW